ncbi:uncharacterized protein TrAFT101_010665 [Trichoderma asperellum]|uniref:uncharacterized protein n=1 Tax=Trichoderma asperellum TaxID=101201 RepID=UPI00332E2CFF|nr:hypothetical protein TrAFT101_010665 [Trichoderma asperellum]
MWRALESGCVEQSDASHPYGFDCCLLNEIVPFVAKATSIEMKVRIGRGDYATEYQRGNKVPQGSGSLVALGDSEKWRQLLFALPHYQKHCVRLLCHSFVHRAVRRSVKWCAP